MLIYLRIRLHILQSTHLTWFHRFKYIIIVYICDHIFPSIVAHYNLLPDISICSHMLRLENVVYGPDRVIVPPPPPEQSEIKYLFSGPPTTTKNGCLQSF